MFSCATAPGAIARGEWHVRFDLGPPEPGEVDKSIRMQVFLPVGKYREKGGSQSISKSVDKIQLLFLMVRRCVVLV